MVNNARGVVCLWIRVVYEVISVSLKTFGAFLYVGSENRCKSRKVVVFVLKNALV